ncbi:MAG: diaminopimelate epimerase [Planctomycetes bacterium]|nr:diaminopimelate epimerase [Planctomycetota bacterium]MCB9916827.1 diaminopimelate epimerase [Planctomycetota bacterium]
MKPGFEVPFHKMEGCGNDYVYVLLEDLANDECRHEVLTNAPAIARQIADRHFGIGSDGLVLVGRESGHDARMTMFNADGSRSAMCGNALRCIGRLLADENAECDAFSIRTDDSAVDVHVARAEGRRPTLISVVLDHPKLMLDEIPFVPGDDARVRSEPTSADDTLRPAEVEIDVADGCVRASVLSFGNPHCVVFLDDPENAWLRIGRQDNGAPDMTTLDIERIGSEIERHAGFPDGVNVEFVIPAVRGRGPGPDPEGSLVLVQRTWERGSGETLACGSGACATAVAAVARRKVSQREPAIVQLRGGVLRIDVDRNVTMEGPARRAFSGTFTVRFGADDGYDGVVLSCD